jgi:C-terminal processing protease CtpA/Prc
MKTPGVMLIVSPLDGSPAQEAGLLPKDQIIQIDDHKVTQDMDLTTAVSWIK